MLREAAGRWHLIRIGGGCSNERQPRSRVAGNVDRKCNANRLGGSSRAGAGCACVPGPPAAWSIRWREPSLAVVIAQLVELSAGNDSVQDAREVRRIVCERVEVRDRDRRDVRKERGMDSGVIPWLVRPQPDELRLPALTVDRRRVRSTGIGARRLERGE